MNTDPLCDSLVSNPINNLRSEKQDQWSGQHVIIDK